MAKPKQKVEVVSQDGLREKQMAQQASMFSVPVPLTELPKTRIEVEKVATPAKKPDPAPNAKQETPIEKPLPITEKPVAEKKHKAEEYDWTTDPNVSVTTKCPQEKQSLKHGKFYEVSVPVEQITLPCPYCGKDAANIRSNQFSAVKLIPYKDELTKQIVIPRPIFTLLGYAQVTRCEHCGKAFNSVGDYNDIVIIEQAGIRNPYPYAARQTWLKEVTDEAIIKQIPVLSGEKYGL